MTTEHHDTAMTQRLFERARELMTVERLVGEPIERDGVTLVPVVSIRGGAGGGGGEGADASGTATGAGEGMGFGLSGRPVGSWAIRDGEAKWQPAVDVTRLVMMANITAIAFFVSRWLVVRVRAKAVRKTAKRA